MPAPRVMAFWACVLLLTQLPGLTALASRPTLERRSTWRGWSWSWSWPGQSSSWYSSRPPQQNSGSYSPHPSQPRPAPAQGYAPPRQKPTPTYHGPQIHVNGSDIHRWLAMHNKFRAQYSAGPLKWSETLVAASKRLTDTCVWHHTRNNEFGENMSAGQRSIEEVVTGWVSGPDEKDSYSGGNTEPSHFTQVVWEATTEVGCFQGMCRDVRGANLPQSPVTFWACNYNPPGNVIGEIAQNVQAAPGGRPLRV